MAKGERGKHTLVNVYSGDIVAASFPARLNLALYIEVEIQPLKDNALSIHVMSNKKNIVKLDGKATPMEKSGVIVFAVPTLLIEIKTNTTLEVKLTSDGYDDTIVLSKKISQGELPRD